LCQVREIEVFPSALALLAAARSRRRTVALVVTRNATVVVRAPWRTPVGYIEDYVYRNSAWIRRKLAEMTRRQALPARKFVSGEEFLYLGKFYKLHVVEELASDVRAGPVQDNLLDWHVLCFSFPCV
jgi:predicted metal-dependent hydrolase